MENQETIIQNKDVQENGTKILEEIKNYNTKQIYIITEEIELKIPLILSYLENYENEIINKIHVVRYILSLIKNIPYNLDIVLAEKSKQKMNLYEIIINEYIYTDKNEKDYIDLLKELIVFIFKKLSLNKDIYRYILSYVSNFLNEKNHNEKNNKNYFNEYNYSRLLELILFFYQSSEDEEPINYFYFNGGNNANITFNNTKSNFLNIQNDLYFLLFVKLIDYNYISKLKDNNKEKKNAPNIMKIKFKDMKDNISINIKYNESGETPESNLNIINIPYSSFNIKETNTILVKLKSNMKIEIFINGNEISLPSNISLEENKKEKIIESIQLFNEFYGICSSIMLYRDSSKNKIKNTFPTFLMTGEKDNKIIKEYQNGFFKEELLIPIIKAYLKNRVQEKNIFDNTLNNLSEGSENELHQFIDYNLISIYIPTRTVVETYLNQKIEGAKAIDEEIREINLIDSICNFNAYFKNNNLYNNLIYSRSGGVHILSNLLNDFSIDIGGINHLLPLIELMTDYNELLTNANLEKFMNIILYLFPNHKKLIDNEENSKFFYFLSLFLEKIPEKYYSDVGVHIKSILITLDYLQSENSINDNNNTYKIYNNEFFNNVCLNEKILFKFCFKDRNLIYENIYKHLINKNLEQKRIDINIANIINILLFTEKDKYTHFCCKKHAAYFKKESEIMKPELNEQIKYLIDIIKLLLKQFILEINNIDNPNFKTRDQLIQIFELLTFDITPCLQMNILKIFFDFIQNNNEKIFEYLNINNRINEITLFIYKTSLFEVKELAFNYLIELTNKKLNNNNNLEQYIEKYTTYYYFPKDQENQNNRNFKKTTIINNIKYNLMESNEELKLLFSYYDKNHYLDIMKHIFEKAEHCFKRKICFSTNFNILISIASNGDVNFIIKLLNLVQDELKKNNDNNDLKNIHIIFNNKKLLQWLLDTCYLAYLMKKSITNKVEFISNFSFGELNDDKEKESIIDKIILLSSNFLLDIFYDNIYKLDYLLTWSKYYNEIEDDKNGFLSNRNFIFEYFIEKIINRYIERSKNNNKNTNFKSKLYLANIAFEYIALQRYKGFISGGVLKDLENLYTHLCPIFIFSLLNEFSKNQKEEKSIYLLNEKWKKYLIIKQLFENLEFFQLDKECGTFSDEKDIYNSYIQNKHNAYINELKIYFSDFKNYFKKNNNDFCNQGMGLIFLKYHYYTLLLTVITNNFEFKEKLNEFASFIMLIIIASTTLSIDNSKSSNNNNIKQNIIWPTEEDYKSVQETIKIILINILYFFKEKITEVTNKMKKYTNTENDSESKNLYDNYYFIKIYLINIILFILKLLNTIYTDVRKKELEKRKSEGRFRGWMSKVKNMFSGDKEGIKLTGGYLFIKDFINNCISENNLQNKKSIENQESTNNLTDEEKRTFLDDIPNFTLNDISSKDYEKSELNKTLESLYSKYIENDKIISNYLSTNREKYQKQIFPFIPYIFKRNKTLSNIIPSYDISIYTSFGDNFLCLTPNYLPELANDTIKMEDIQKFNSNLIDIIKMYQINLDFNENDKKRKYRKIKKNLFSFNGIFSSKKYFYEKSQYICKYKLLDHMTEDFTKIFLTPIIDVDYYLPKFSRFELKNLFRKENKDQLTQITKITDLSLKDITNLEEKNVENIEFSNLNGLYLIKEVEFKNMKELYKSIEGTLTHYLFFKKFIDKKHQISGNYNNCLENACLVKTSYHIRGFFYNNKKEIGFYSYDKIPYNYNKKEKREVFKEKNPKVYEIQKDYDPDREACFGSIFSPQIEKYEYLHFSIPYENIVLILKRRYYYKVTALEIFTTDKKSYLFKFDHNKLEDIIKNLKSYLNQKLEDIYIEYSKHYNKIGYLNLKSIENNMNKNIYKNKYMNLNNIYDQWKKWEISTMRLLMYLNIYANRSYNDINQYPVFPWIIIDYNSEKFPKMDSKELFRPLNTPMGMLEISDDSIQRRQDYLDHWEISREDDDREDEFDRYGSHYSTSLYVSYYLVRIFPFANIRIELQGTSFDDPNRLFNCLRTSFDCSSTQKSDVRELIPELFCFPEILLNKNDFNLGEIKDNSIKDNNTQKPKLKKIEEVETPKWCENNAYFFIKKHRELLESYEVSNNLNEWLNLIFGSKQKGQSANEIKNLYNAQTYEDFEKTFDEMSLDEKDITCRMLEFGVTPHQIFKSDTSKRKLKLDSKIKKQLYFNTFENIRQNKLSPEVKIKNCIVYEEIQSIINFTNAKKIYYFDKDKNSENYKKYLYIMGNYNLDIFLRKSDKDIVKNEEKKDDQPGQNLINPYYGDEIGDEIYEEIQIKKIEKKSSIKINNFNYAINNKQPIAWLNNGSILVKGGYWNGNIVLKNIGTDKDNSNNININNDIHKTFIYTTSENSPIMKILIDKNETFAICGNTNGTIFIFKISPINKLNWSIFKNINNHNYPITSMAIHENLNIAIICSQDGLCMLYTLPYFKLYNSFIIGKKEKENQIEEILCPNIVLISDKPLPCFIFYVELKRSIYFYSINGEFLKKQEIKYSLKENNIKIYTDYQFADYLVIYNSNYKTFDIHGMIDFALINRSSPIPEGDLVDYIISKEKDHILILCKTEIQDKYKLYMLKDSESAINWK